MEVAQDSSHALQSDAGQSFLAKCGQLGLQVEYELHAMKELLPRDLFPNDSHAVPGERQTRADP